MNSYLNPKKEKQKWETPVMLVCALMAVSSVSALKDVIAEGKTASAVVGIAMALAFAWVVVRYCLRAKDRRSAQTIANTLSQIQEEQLSLSKLESLFPGKKAAAEIKRLLEKGYLQNVYIDWQQSALHLTAPNHKRAALVKIICPNCSAENMVQEGWYAKCEYCGKVLSANEADQEEEDL